MEDAEGQQLLEEMCPSLVKDSQGKVILSDIILILWLPKQISHTLLAASALNLVGGCTTFLLR